MSTLPRPLIVLLSLTCVVILAAALSAAQAVIAPVVFAIFVIALVWPLQGALQKRMPAVAALLVTMLVTLVTLLGLALLVAWAFGRVGAHVVANAAQIQAFYAAQIAWAEARGIDVAGSIAAQFDARGANDDRRVQRMGARGSEIVEQGQPFQIAARGEDDLDRPFIRKAQRIGRAGPEQVAIFGGIGGDFDRAGSKVSEIEARIEHAHGAMARPPPGKRHQRIEIKLPLESFEHIGKAPGIEQKAAFMVARVAGAGLVRLVIFEVVFGRGGETESRAQTKGTDHPENIGRQLGNPVR
jgi:hypothetical protein